MEDLVKQEEPEIIGIHLLKGIEKTIALELSKYFSVEVKRTERGYIYKKEDDSLRAIVKKTRLEKILYIGWNTFQYIGVIERRRNKVEIKKRVYNRILVLVMKDWQLVPPKDQEDLESFEVFRPVLKYIGQGYFRDL